MASLAKRSGIHCWHLRPLPIMGMKPTFLYSTAAAFVKEDATEKREWNSILLDSDAYASLLQVSADMKQLKQVHAHIIIKGLDQNNFLGSKLVGMYAMCGSLKNACLVFDKIKFKRSALLWNGMIREYARNGTCDEALALYYQMQPAGIQPDDFTFPLVLKACASLSSLQEGEEIHGLIVRRGFESDVFVQTSLLDMYAKCGCLEDARQVFDKMFTKDAVSWNAMIAAHFQNGHANEALTLFRQMQMADVKPNLVTMVCVLPACSRLGVVQQGKCIHAHVIRNGLESFVSVENSLVAMYAKCGSIKIARHVWDRMSKRDVVSWSSMIAGYVQNEQANEALTLFHQMQIAGITPDLVTMVNVLPACGHLAALQEGKWIHDYILTSGYELDVLVETALVDMYVKCGRIDVARTLFDKMSNRDVVSWNAMIAGYSHNGFAGEALILFHQMNLAHMTPDSTTMVSVLPAIARLAALQQGKWLHAYIIRNGFESDVSVGNSLIAMYAKCGNIEIAHRWFEKMFERDVVSWSVMIAGYGMHGQWEDALGLFLKMQQTGMKPNYITFVSVLSACSHAGLVDKGWEYFNCMSQGYCITPGVEHYACMVDLLGRAGHLEEAHEFIKRMPIEPDAGVWGALLGACRTHCSIQLAECTLQHLLDLEPKNAGNYVLLSNIYAAAGRWDDVARVRTMLKDQQVKKQPGCSWIEIKNRFHAFVVGDRSHPQSERIYGMLESLAEQMKAAGYVADTRFFLHDVEEDKDYIL
eukprot:Gb_10709 [translate_table: standard]